MPLLPPPLARIAMAVLAAAALGACGQKGPLFIPSTPAAAQRATLPQTVFGGAAAAPVTAVVNSGAAVITRSNLLWPRACVSE